ncbi:MAG: hypothetical protein K2L37_00975 [Lactobacillus sp.]|nr:hypothetical protein [Lactobacillus sp.]
MVFKDKRVILKLVTEEGITSKKYSFSSIGKAEKFLGRKPSYFSQTVRKRGFAKDVDGNWFAIVSIDGKNVVTKDKTNNFYRKYFGKRIAENERQRIIKRRKIIHALVAINLKYDNLIQASDSLEFSRLQELVR